MSTTQVPLGTAPEDVAPAAEKKSGAREYVVLESAGDKVWREVAIVSASSDVAAKESLSDKLKVGSSYIAVAKRYWNPKRPKIETKTTISFE